VAIVQTSVRRLIAYSAIAHAGYMLLAILSHNQQSLASLIYYAITYGLTTIGAFGVVAVVEQGTGGEKLSDFAGLSRRAPVVSFCMLIFMLSLAGIPPLAGFFGKFLLLKAAVEQGVSNHAYYWLVGIAITGVIISIYYYFGVVRAIYWSKDAADLSPIAISTPIKVCLYACVTGIFYLGLFPNPVVNAAMHAVAALKI